MLPVAPFTFTTVNSAVDAYSPAGNVAIDSLINALNGFGKVFGDCDVFNPMYLKQSAVDPKMLAQRTLRLALTALLQELQLALVWVAFLSLSFCLL